MVDYLKIIDFTKEIKEEPRLKDHLTRAAEVISNEHKNDENYQRPVKNDESNNIVIVAGLPVIPEEKVEKLQGFLKAKILPSLEVPEPQIVFDISNKEMHGSALFIFADPDIAKSAASKINGFQFDKTHALSACTKSEFEDMVKMEDNYAAPKVLLRDELQEWLLDHRNREQLLVRVANRHYLQWFDHVSKAEPIFSGNTLRTDHGAVLRFEWSKSGSYLVTFHDDGFCLWAGKTFEKLNFHPHLFVQNVEFSPDETYVLSFNGTAGDAPNSENYIVWRVGAAAKLRSFKASQSETWGSYKWNFDGKYLAGFGNDLLNIYELPSMSRIADPQTQKKSPLKVPNIQNIEWAPNKNLLCIAAYKTSTGTKGDTQGKVYVIEVPSRQNLKWKTITWEFSSCEIHWENTGNKIILALRKIIRNKKTSMVLQIGDIKHNNIIVEEHEFPDAKVVNIDEAGKKVAILSLESSQKDAQGSTVGYTVELFKTDEEVRGKYLQKLGGFADKPISHVMWSPNGVFFALVNIDKLSAKIGVLEFGLVKGSTVEIIKSTKFSYMVSAAWDPSGRYFLTSSSKGQYTIWTAFGDAIIKDNFAEITQIQWRPKPKIILPGDLEEQITSNIKKYTKKYEEEDDRILNEDKYKKQELRKKQKEEFEAILSKKKKTWSETREERVRLLGFDEDNVTFTDVDEIVEGEELVEGRK